MSTQESTTAKKAAAAGKAFLREDALPTQGGGGVAFPEGALGRALYLDEWEFIRYCTVQGERDHQEKLESKRDSRLKDLKTLAVWVGAAAFGIVAVWAIGKSGLTMAPFFIATCLLYFAALLYGSLRTPGWFSRTCPDARPVPFLKQWPLVARLDARRRSLSAVWQRVYRICFPLGFAWMAFDEREVNAMLEIVIATFLGFAALEGLIALAFLFVYLPIRLGWRSAVDHMAPR